MKKDATRDYATEAFRKYARGGCVGYDDARRRIYEKELRRMKIAPPDAAVMAAEAAVAAKYAYLCDIAAVDKTMDLLQSGNKSHIVQCVTIVYFADAWRPIRKCDISSRVIRACEKIHASERCVYRWLREARLLFASLRGLTVDDDTDIIRRT